MSAKIYMVFGLSLLLLAAGSLVWNNDPGKEGATTPMRSVRIAVPAVFSSALPIIAEDGGHWQKAGLDVTLLTPGTGAECMSLLEQGAVDFAVAYDTPVVNSILRGTAVRVMSELHAARVNTVLVYRKDRNIMSPTDMAGKKVGIIGGTNAEFFFDLFMKANVLDENQVEIVASSSTSQVADITSGQLDATVMWEPRVSSLVNDNPGVFAVFTLPFYSEVSMITTTAAFADANPGILRRVIKGIASAKQELEADPAQGRALVRDFLGQRGMHLNEEVWGKVQFRMGLGHFLQTTLQEQIRQKLVRTHSASPVKIDLYNPDVLPYMEPRPLLALMPGWVSLK